MASEKCKTKCRTRKKFDRLVGRGVLGAIILVVSAAFIATKTDGDDDYGVELPKAK